MPEYSTQQLIDDIALSQSPAEFDHAARQSLAAFDALNERTIEHQKVALACRAGCSLCCWLRVDVFAHEVFLIAHHIRTHFAADAVVDLMARLSAHADSVMPLSPFEHATQNIACPLLRDGRCSVYAVRPQACRRHHSQDFTACQFTFDHPTDLESPAAHDRELFRALTEAMCQNIEGYAELGFDHTIYELGTALNEALNDPSSWQRWRDHEPAFIHASVTPTE